MQPIDAARIGVFLRPLGMISRPTFALLRVCLVAGWQLGLGATANCPMFKPPRSDSTKIVQSGCVESGVQNTQNATRSSTCTLGCVEGFDASNIVVGRCRQEQRGYSASYQGQSVKCTSKYAGTDISLSHSEIVSQVLSANANTTSFTIKNSGTADLLIQSVDAYCEQGIPCPWITVFQNISGDKPRYAVPLSPNSTLELQLEFRSSSLMSKPGNYTGALNITSNKPGNSVSVPINVEVLKTRYGVVPDPLKLSAKTLPGATHNHFLRLHNSKCGPLSWTISACDCETSHAQDGWCRLIGGASWVHVQRCNGTLSNQTTERLAVKFISQTSAGWRRTIMKVVSREQDLVFWQPVQMSIVVRTDASHFSVAKSSYGLVRIADNSRINDGVLTVEDPCYITLHPFDRYNNSIELSEKLKRHQFFVSLYVVARIVSGGRRRTQSESKLFEYALRYSDTARQYRRQFSLQSNGTFRLKLNAKKCKEDEESATCTQQGQILEIAPEHSMSREIKGKAKVCNPVDGVPRFASKRGSTCLYSRCKAGRELLPSSSGCTLCAKGKYSVDGRKCVDCKAGTFCNVKGCETCSQCDAGKAAASGSHACSVCQSDHYLEPSKTHDMCVCQQGHYSLSHTQRNGTNMCTPCSGLAQSNHSFLGFGALGPRYPVRPSSVQWTTTKVCAGGRTGKPVICPQKGLYFEFDNRSQDVTLLPCENRRQCIANTNGTQRCASAQQQHAECRVHHRGRFCADCMPGYSKVGGICVECRGAHWLVFIVTVVTMLCLTLWMLFQSVTLFCPAAQATQIFEEADEDGSGWLDPDEVSSLLLKMGDPLHAAKKAKTIQKMTGVTDMSSVRVDLDQFAAWCHRNQPSAMANIVTIFLQTAAIIGANNGLKGLELLNLNAGEALGECYMPDLPVATPLLVPLIATVATVLLISTLYYLIARLSNVHLQPHHHKRAIVFTFLFVFTPITKGCLALLICRPIGSSTDKTYYLGIDMRQTCWEGEHRYSAYLAWLTLFLIYVALPVWLIKKVRVQSFVFRASDSEGAVSAILNPDPLNLLYCMARPKHRYWWAFEMFLKLIINLLVLLGGFFDFEWQLYLQAVLICAALYGYHAQPYVLPFDNELMVTTWLMLTLVLSLVTEDDQEPTKCDDPVVTNNMRYIYGTCSCGEELSCYRLLSVSAIFAVTAIYITRSFLTRCKARLPPTFGGIPASSGSPRESKQRQQNAARRFKSAVHTVSMSLLSETPEVELTNAIYNDLIADPRGVCADALVSWFACRQPEVVELDLIRSVRQIFTDLGVYGSDPMTRDDLDTLLDALCSGEWTKRIDPSTNRIYFVHPSIKQQPSKWERPSTNEWLQSLYDDGRLTQPREKSLEETESNPLFGGAHILPVAPARPQHQQQVQQDQQDQQDWQEHQQQKEVYDDGRLTQPREKSLEETESNPLFGGAPILPVAPARPQHQQQVQQDQQDRQEHQQQKEVLHQRQRATAEEATATKGQALASAQQQSIVIAATRQRTRKKKQCSDTGTNMDALIKQRQVKNPFTRPHQHTMEQLPSLDDLKNLLVARLAITGFGMEDDDKAEFAKTIEDESDYDTLIELCLEEGIDAFDGQSPAPQSEWERQQTIDNIFAAIDTNANGFIQKHDINAYAQRAGLHEAMDEYYVDALWRVFAENRTSMQKLEFVKFARLLQAMSGMARHMEHTITDL